MSQLHLETLIPEATELFPKLAAFKKEFYLAGGTALALQLGHRVSVDFDLFTPQPIKKTLLPMVESVFSVPVSNVLVNSSSELSLIVGGVKCTFLEYPFAVLLPLQEGEPVDLLSAKEILATKAYSIGRRGSFKDYVDLYVGLRESVASLGEIIELAKRKYEDAFNDRLFLEQLLYLDDVDEITLLMRSGQQPTKQLILDFFTKAIVQLKL
ncbi:hypothetical protein A3G63_01335 [Candidatus Kaiserbacteria bacterium RIFCSPLOWO2_12_FULL_52_8]|uniref:Nucleotidyl transferase AbiEii/AbiGii toxin family protein n=1 Tax=Candidatus Kaiserbacteria bacterium RIFCSPHIGHO2_01_FULL_53_31 TaxID=1798481 RepID=A0A1F6CIW8_9BACT|nr:MAG: hypothetical protein A2678_02410 [Candidatus Kaiserbacteria bacterium RIFCSPHIGHO2_01_FULL_53_31]OGG94359.1 MAG: hypothetical protein A3G63_01335 [Candidatus Kaiserbacteria bacterium RIFCSPLOWO2_12_FULL_52_8]